MSRNTETWILVLLLLTMFALLLSGCATESGKKQQQWVDAMKGLHYESTQ